MTFIRSLTLVAVFTLVAAACGGDDSTSSETFTTVPTTAETTTSIAEEPEEDGPEPAEGVDAEPATTTSLPDGDLSNAAIRVEEFGEFEQPIDAVVAPNGEWWLAQRTGEVLVVDPATAEVGDLVLDLSAATVAGGEQGLLGLAVDGEALYANYTDLDGTTRVDAFPLDEAGRPGEGISMLEIEQPFTNHNGGALDIGPDGHLYVAVGDGGSADDPLGAGQDPNQILGSIVRIDPTPAGPESYAIPADNPYADGGGVPEIFLIGVRNPWRFSFDDLTGDLWIADVGQADWEEITLLLGANGWGRGANLGWSLREGVVAFDGDRPPDNVDPVFVYAHDGGVSGCSITGGEVYRGAAIPELHGAYVFGDYCTAEFWAVSVSTGAVIFNDLDVSLPGGDLVDFASLPNGELVAMSLGGTVVRILPA